MQRQARRSAVLELQAHAGRSPGKHSCDNRHGQRRQLPRPGQHCGQQTRGQGLVWHGHGQLLHYVLRLGLHHRIVPRPPPGGILQQGGGAAEHLCAREGHTHALPPGLLGGRGHAGVGVGQGGAEHLVDQREVEDRRVLRGTGGIWVQGEAGLVRWGQHAVGQCGRPGERPGGQVAVHLPHQGHVPAGLCVELVAVQQVQARQLVHQHAHAAPHGLELHRVDLRVLQERVDFLLHLQQVHLVLPRPGHQHGRVEGAHKLPLGAP
mmetsp:Transcript_33490/g.73778  ORF Transcript_33490/g.73778 Transcript_33490/m.73778 type:complete len:264 (+) Transcript_33490:1210-2001(+)